MTEWLQRQLDAIKADAETWPAWKRREVGLEEMQLSVEDANLIEAALATGSARPRLMPRQAPPVIRGTRVNRLCGCY